MDKLEAVFELEKETKNTVRYAEVSGDQAPIANTVYLQKWALQALGGGEYPKRIRVTVAAE